MRILPRGSLPRAKPALRLDQKTLPSGLRSIVFAGSRILVPAEGTLLEGIAVDGASSAIVLRAPGEPKEDASPPGVAPDGTIGITTFRMDRAEGLVFHRFDANGRHLSAIPTGFDYEESEGPDWYPGPGPMLPPEPVAGGWIVCAGESLRDHSPWQVAFARGDRIEWTATGFPHGCDGTTLLLAPRDGEIVAHDAASGAVRWSASLDVYRASLAEGVFGAVTQRGLVLIDALGGRVLHEEGVAASGNMAPGDVGVARHAVVVHDFAARELRVMAPDGTPITRAAFEAELLGFDGVHLLATLDRTRIVCALAADPGAWTWNVPLPDPGPYALEAAAASGFVAVWPLSGGRCWVLGPEG